MKNLKNKFIFSIIFFILLILGYETYSFYSIRDTNSYVTLTNGTGFLDQGVLTLQNKEVIKVGDTIETIGEESLAIIEWGDNSITRLGGNTQIVIKENNITSDLSKIQISLNILNGKTWNNVVSLFGKDSYFKQYVDDVEAGVRGTVFEINKDKDYVYVENHEITLKNTKTSAEIVLPEKKPMSLKTFTLIDLQEFLIKIKDQTWEEVNKKFDKELILNLQSGITKKLSENNPINMILGIFSKKYSTLNSINSFDDINKVKAKISKLNDIDKNFIYNKIFSKYQSLNFLSPEDKDYDKKLYYKEVLILLSYDEKNTESLIKNSLYDINDMVSSNNLSKLNDTINILANNKDKIKNLNIDFNKYVNLSSVPPELKDSLTKGLEPLGEIFKINLNFGSIKEFGTKASEFLKNNVGNIINSVKK